MMRLMVTHYHDSSDDDLKAIHAFRRSTIQLYLQNLDARSGWQTLIWYAGQDELDTLGLAGLKFHVISLSSIFAQSLIAN